MELLENESLELTVLMPCLNESATLAFSVEEAFRFLREKQLRGEVLVADNGSTDGSAALAEQCGARVVTEKRRGYGAALRCGIANARGRYILFGDCDTTYDFYHLDGLYRALTEGADAVIGDRFAGGIEPGAMPLSHRWGVRFLSLCGRLKFHTDIRDFHCGLRGLSRAAAERVDFHTDGMEFATEFIAVLLKNGCRIAQVPVPLRRCRAERRPHLRTIPDGLRHLRFILSSSQCSLF